MSEKLYAKRDPEAQGEFYQRHLSAMTSEGLHEKCDIACELAHRDIMIFTLQKVLFMSGKYIDFVMEKKIGWDPHGNDVLEMIEALLPISESEKGGQPTPTK